MDKQFDNELRGVIFKNDRREKDTQPHAKGSCQIAGVEYWISAWTQKDKNGNPYQSLSFTAKQEVHDNGMANAQIAAEPVAPPISGGANFDDDIPFAQYDKGEFA